MHEIISLQVGQCGNQVGSAFWQTIHDEHGLDSDGIFRGTSEIQGECLEVYFDEASSNKYTPRAVLIDLDPTTMQEIRFNPTSQQLRPNNLIAGQCPTGKNWARGHYTDEVEVVDQALDAVRRGAEQCDCLSGFQLIHSLGGGSGSGLGTLLIQILREEFPDRMIATFSVLPSRKRPEVVVEPYNAVLSINQLMENADLTFCIDNQALFDTCNSNPTLENPFYLDINQLIATAMSGVTTVFRFPGHVNTDLRRFAMDMVPIPRFQFLTMGIAPLASAFSRPTPDPTVPELFEQIFDPKDQLSSSDLRNGRLLAFSAIFRGKVNMKNVEKQINDTQSQISACSGLDIQTTLCSIPQSGLELSSTMVTNSTAIKDPLSGIRDQFNYMFRRKQYLFPYSMAGLLETELTEGEADLSDLIADYQEYEESGTYDK